MQHHVTESCVVVQCDMTRSNSRTEQIFIISRKHFDLINGTKSIVVISQLTTTSSEKKKLILLLFSYHAVYSKLSNQREISQSFEIVVSFKFGISILSLQQLSDFARISDSLQHLHDCDDRPHSWMLCQRSFVLCRHTLQLATIMVEGLCLPYKLVNQIKQPRMRKTDLVLGKQFFKQLQIIVP